MQDCYKATCNIKVRMTRILHFHTTKSTKRMKYWIAVVLVVIGAALADEDDGGLPPLPPMAEAPPPPQTDPPPPPPQTDAPPPPPTDGPFPPTNAPPSDCKDKAFNCEGHLKKYCKTRWSIKYNWCRKTCGACDEGDCKDRVSNCFHLQNQCDRGAVAILCQRTCKVCS